MSFISFGNTMSLIDAATPSAGAWTVAYDIDGVLKQKDEFGVITPIGGGPTGGMGSTPSLSQVLEVGNNAGPYSIGMNDGSSIYSNSGSLLLDSGNTTLESTSITGNSSLVLRPNDSSYILSTDLVTGSYSSIQIYPGNGTTTLPYINFLSGDSTNYTVVTQNSLNYSVSLIDATLLDNVKIIESGSTYDTGSQNKAYVHINTFNSTTNNGIQNSVIIGGSNMTASQNNTVYLGNNVNINNEYTLPNIDGVVNQVLKTDGNGNVGWIDVTTSASNGLQVVSNEVILGGTLSQNTTIDGSNYNLSIDGLNRLSFTASSFINSQVYPSTDYSSTQFSDGYSFYANAIFGSSTYSQIYLDYNSLTIESIDGLVGGVSIRIFNTDQNGNDGSIDNRLIITDDVYQKGAVYDDDYSSNFTTYSLVTKGYVDSVAAAQTGTSGTSGYDGTSGTSGYNGTSGTSGYDGTSGTSGFNGTSGTSGFGTSGTSGVQGIPGETLSPLGVESDYSSMTQSRGTSYSIPTPNPLDVYIVQDTSHLWIYDTSSGAANSEGWVDMGPIQGPQGLPGTNGTSGSSGVSGNDSSNSGRWIFNNAIAPPSNPGSTYFIVDDYDLSNTSQISISSTSSTNLLYSEWLKEITLTNTSVLLKIIEVGNTLISGIYYVYPNDVTWGLDYTDIILGSSNLIGGGLMTNGKEYSISFVINGDSGTSGSNGTSGTSGLEGTSGTSGLEGTSGTSAVGTSGTSGLTGTSGTSGTGTSGTSGLTGTSGTSGLEGTSGTSGLEGTSGTSGLEGTSGTSGLTGTSGTSGLTGTSGTSGTGTSGTSGLTGTSGTSGLTGTSGTSGLTGTSGTSGLTGTSGTSGINGTSGTSGFNGTNGTSGSSGTSGLTGTSGTSGAKGDPGESLTALGVELNYSSMTQSHGTSYSVVPPNNLDAYILQDTSHFWIYNPSSLASNSEGWVDMGELQGPQGIQGNNGTSGTSGLTGTSGTSGINGTSGTSGINGTSGTSGLTGTSGTSGLTGTSGTSGLTGTSGTSGLTGTSGTSGLTGTSGTSGLTGTAGTSGRTGTSGTSGLTGTSGTSGLAGTSGTSGSTGTAGTSGRTGTSGTSGLTGTSGTSGLTGTSGTSGFTGTSGTSGLAGTSGTSGISGTAGTSGRNGTSGTSGLTGTSGTSGFNGTNGTSGTGTSGTSGLTGTSGTSATGTSGTSGVNGTSGTSGTRGTSGTSGLTGTSGTSGLNGTNGTSGTGTSGTSGSGIGKYTATQSFTGGVTYSIAHNLNTQAILFNMWDETTGELIVPEVKKTSVNAIDVRSSVTIVNGRVVIIS